MSFVGDSGICLFSSSKQEEPQSAAVEQQYVECSQVDKSAEEKEPEEEIDTL